MALLAEVGTFTEKLTTGDQTVTLADSGITPKVIIIWGCNLLSATTATQNFGVFGFWADDSSGQACVAWFDADAGAAMDCSRRFNGSKVIEYTDISGAAATAACTVSSVTAGSFTLNWTTVQGDARIFNYLVLGGTDITNVDLLVLTSPTSVSTTSHNIGFQPDGALVLGGAYTSNPGGAANLLATLGVADGTDQAALGWSGMDGAADALLTCRYGTGRFIDASFNDAAYITGDISFTATGYDISWAPVDASARYFAVLAIKGIRTTVIDEVSRTSNGTQNITNAPSQPAAALIFSAGNTDDNLPHNIAVSIGAGAGASQQTSCGVTSTDGAATSVCDRHQITSQVLTALAQNGGAANAQASWAGVTSTGFDLSWGTTDGSAYKFGGIMFSAAVSGGTLVNGGLVNRGLVNAGLAG